MLPHEIKVGEFTFENITIYSQKDKIRNHGTYLCKVEKLQIVVKKEENGDTLFSIDGLGTRKFTIKNVNIELACKAALKHAVVNLKKLSELIEKQLTSN